MRLMDLLEEGLKRAMDKLKEKERDKVRKTSCFKKRRTQTEEVKAERDHLTSTFIS